jgi:hypothetical protein
MVSDNVMSELKEGKQWQGRTRRVTETDVEGMERNTVKVTYPEFKHQKHQNNGIVLEGFFMIMPLL